MHIVITGHTGVIGSAIAKHRMAMGDTVTGISRRWSDENVTQALRADVGSFGDVAKAAWKVPEADALITCAAVQGPVGPAVASDPLLWEDAVTTNLIGTFNAIRAFWDTIRGSATSRIICLSGGGASKGRKNFSAYAASKTAVVRMVETVAEELQGKGTINAVAPGAFLSDMTHQIIMAGPEKAGEEEYAAAMALVGVKAPDMTSLMALIDYLLSPESDGVTGRFLSAQWDRVNAETFAGELKPERFRLRRTLA